MAVVLALAEIFTVVMERNVCEKVFDKKHTGILAQFLVWAFFYLVSNGLTYIANFPTWLNPFVFSILFFGVLSVLYEGLFKIRLVFVVFLCLIGILSEVIVCFAGNLVGIDIMHMLQNAEVMLVYMILSKLVWFIEIKAALLFLKKNKNIKIRRMDWVEVFTVPVSSIVIVLAMFLPFTDDFIWLKLAASVLVLMINLFTFYNYNELQEKALYRAEKEFLTQQVGNYAIRLQEMSRNWHQMREYRHEMKQKYLLVDTWMKQRQYFKTSVAQKNGIKVNLTAVIPYDVMFDDVDLYSLLGNLFDNAIDAVKQTVQEDRIITLTAKLSGENLYLEMGNPYTGDLKKRGFEYLTTKENSGEHGLGLRIIKDIAKRHNGEVIISDTDHYFNVKILLYHFAK